MRNLYSGTQVAENEVAAWRRVLASDETRVSHEAIQSIHAEESLYIV